MTFKPDMAAELAGLSAAIGTGLDRVADAINNLADAIREQKEPEVVCYKTPGADKPARPF